MAIARYLAMTAEEFASAASVTEPIAWMACHFSPYSTSLSNLPQSLPAHSLLLLNDSTPPRHTNPEIVAKDVANVLKSQNCSGILLDFQRPGNSVALEIVKALLQLDCRICVSECYAKDLNCPVFLPPLPLTMPLDEYIAPWKGREIWLDTALSCEQITVTATGSTSRTIFCAQECPLADEVLHCHYHITVNDDSIVFTLQRTKADLAALLADAEKCGIAATVGLYQELK